jgi:hypothetical protein
MDFKMNCIVSNFSHLSVPNGNYIQPEYLHMYEILQTHHILCVQFHEILVGRAMV